MLEIRSILCPVDFSEGSERALNAAMALAKRTGADVRLLHVLPTAFYGAPPFTPVVAPTPDSAYVARTEAALRELGEKCAKDGVPWRACVSQGSVPQEIDRASTGADLVVMGTHGRTGLAHMLIGSVAERVVRTSRIPVLTVPLGAGSDG